MGPIVQAMQLLTSAAYQPLGPLVENHDFPLLVKREQIVYVAKLARPDDVAVLEKLMAHPVTRMPRIQKILAADDCVVTVETLINGQNLVSYLTKNGPFTTTMVKQVAIDVLKTLSELATLGIVHRDVKLSNIMVKQGRYYLIDVNAARQYHDHQSTDTRLLGTSGFAAPENYGFAQTDQRSDIYALGIVLNCLLTGNVPVDSQTSLKKLTPDSFWAPIIKKATALDPNQRYQSASAMLAAVQGRRIRAQRRFKRSLGWLSHFWQQHGRQVRRGLWIVYGIFMTFMILAGFSEKSWSARRDLWWGEFVLLVMPVIAHRLNVWLYRRYPNVTWHKYGNWLRAAEFLVILAMIIGSGNP
ncbi:protein kinase domain-containing protein [Lactiplantibacillus carotarum]|uniref:protein kinase domain-containing protein n=1 Tax=Lactiplantibacillus carotarum TaxID=2993456 RepID=UPI00298F2C61|nr:protein kinase [Lactiplantibacillus carotarum]